MKRYVLFAYNPKRPRGGWHDFAGFYATLQEAQKAAEKMTYHQIVDLEEKRIVEEQEKSKE